MIDKTLQLRSELGTFEYLTSPRTLKSFDLSHALKSLYLYVLLVC
jgi:hypothetical protein